MDNRLGNLLSFSIVLRDSKTKAKPSGLPDSNFIILCGDKENEAKESLALRWACLVRQGGNLNSVKTVRLNVYTSPAGPEALESLSFCRELYR